MSLFKRDRDTRSQEIVEMLAMWAEGLSGEPGRQLVDKLLFQAALIHYGPETDHLSSTTAVAVIRRKADALIAEAAARRAA